MFIQRFYRNFTEISEETQEEMKLMDALKDFILSTFDEIRRGSTFDVPNEPKKYRRMHMHVRFLLYFDFEFKFKSDQRCFHRL